ncbi:MAG: hypothetical protein R3Y21_03375 [Mycoplasmatota bacterium]
MKKKSKFNKLKKLFNKENIFIIASIIFILFMIIYYGNRLVYYYKIEHPDVESETVYLTDILISTESLSSPGLIKDGDTYYYSGLVDDNYLEYSGILFRIVGINEDSTITLVADQNITLLNYNNYIDYLNETEVLNSGIFANNINPYFLVNTSICDDTVDDIDNITCDSQSSDYLVNLLSLNDYVKAGSIDSYLYNESYFYTSTITSDNNYYYVFDLGGVSSKETTDYQNYGIRPTITLKADINLISGDGTVNSPYTIESETANSLADANIYDYVNYSNQTFQIIGKEEEKVLVVLNDYLQVDGEMISRSFDDSTSIYDTDTIIGSYLNNEYYNSLENQDYIITSNFYNGEYSLNTNYEYFDIFNSYITANIGLLKIGDFTLGNVNDIFLMNNDDQLNYIIKDNKLYGDEKTSEYYIIPVLYLDATLLIDGLGTIDSPYNVSR